MANFAGLCHWMHWRLYARLILRRGDMCGGDLRGARRYGLMRRRLRGLFSTRRGAAMVGDGHAQKLGGDMSAARLGRSCACRRLGLVLMSTFAARCSRSSSCIASIYAPCPLLAAPRLHLLASVSLYPHICACIHLYKIVLSLPLHYAYLILSALCNLQVMPTFDALALCVVVCLTSTERGTGSRSCQDWGISCPLLPLLLASRPPCSMLRLCPALPWPIVCPSRALYARCMTA